MEPLPFPLSSRGADLPAASQEWNERVDIEPLPTHERSCFVSGHDFSRAAHQPSTMGFSPCSYYEHILFIRRSRLDLCQIKGGCSLGTLSLSNGPALSAPLSFLSSRGADLPAASQEWNERVDIEPFPPTSTRALYQGTTLVVPHTSPQRWALAPVPISSTFCSLGAYPSSADLRGNRCGNPASRSRVLRVFAHLQAGGALVTAPDAQFWSPFSPSHSCNMRQWV